ncbi:hypothetical protein ACIKTA_03430 [Hansschlegelia beijingensis]
MEERFLTDGDDYYLDEASRFTGIVHGRAGDDEIHATSEREIFGDEGNDTIFANDASTIAHGGTGDDVLHGSIFQGVLYGDDGDDLLIGTAQRDRNTSNAMYGGSGDDHIIQGGTPAGLSGGDGDDLIEITTRATVDGGSGDDVVRYFHHTVSPFAQPIFIELGDGDDFVDGASSFPSPYTSQTYIAFTNGGAGDDTVVAGSGQDRFNGGEGVDEISYAFETAAVSVDLGAGVAAGAAAGDQWTSVENVTGTAFNDTITGDGAANRLSGGRGKDVLAGGAGDDTLDGGVGADTMQGGRGDDDYYVQHVADRALEATGEGDDRVLSSISYALTGQYVERLRLTGENDADALGNTLKNKIAGNDGDNVIDGWKGSDRLWGGGGHDTFAFTAGLKASNVDTIKDFVSTDDTIRLENKVFVGLADGALAADAFYVGAAAHDADDRIIYDQASGSLFFDRDGIGATYAAVRFAVLANHATIDADDFSVT